MRFYAALLSVFILTSCGFTPLYSNTNTLADSTSILDQIWIDSIPDYEGLYLRNNLIDRFYNNGTPEAPPYILQIKLAIGGRELAIQKNDTTTRAQIVFRADYNLLNRQTREVIDSGNARAVGSYNILSSQYTTLVTEKAARDQALQELADKITLRMAVVLKQKQ